MSALRSALFNAAFFSSTTLYTLVCLPVLPFPRAVIVLIRFWSRAMAWLLENIVGLTLTVRGRENIPDGPFVVASKHQSTWDTIMYFRLLSHPAYVVKKELKRIPIYGWLGTATGWIAVDREGGAKALIGLVRDVRDALAKGLQPVIFPEGTRTAPGERQPYQQGIAALYMRLDVPIVPVALNSGVYWGRRSFIKRPGTLVVDTRRFLAELEERIETATAKLVAEASVYNSVDKFSTHGHRSL